MSADDDDLPLTLKGLHRTPGGQVTVEVGMECFDMARELEQVCAERDAAQARVRALVAALTHVRACATCSELDWAECGDGRDALALLEETR